MESQCTFYDPQSWALPRGVDVVLSQRLAVAGLLWIGVDEWQGGSDLL
jgi:hypothetical protein